MKKNNKINVLYIGAFKPVHDGHINLIERYLDDPNNIVNIIISNIPREGISASSSYKFFRKLFKNNDNVNIEISESNPMLTAINKVKDAESGIFTLASSSKEGDEKRSLDFKNKFKDGKTSCNQNIKVIDNIVNDKPLKENGKILSSSDIRNDIRNNNFNKFIKSYKLIKENYNIDNDDLEEYFNRLKKQIYLND